MSDRPAIREKRRDVRRIGAARNLGVAVQEVPGGRRGGAAIDRPAFGGNRRRRRFENRIVPQRFRCLRFCRGGPFFHLHTSGTIHPVEPLGEYA